jgi:hypothetical protein
MKYTFTRSLMLALCFTLNGCLPKQPRAVSPFFATSGGQVEKTWTMTMLRNGRLVAAVWCDIDFATDGSCAGDCGNQAASRNPSTYNSVRTRDGRFVEWTVDIKSGQAEVATINGKDFRLEDGSLFLVRTHQNGAPVTQVKTDLNGREPDRAIWRQLAKDNAEVEKFLAEADEKK